jgi:hypothetical protein
MNECLEGKKKSFQTWRIKAKKWHVLNNFLNEYYLELILTLAWVESKWGHRGAPNDRYLNKKYL